MERPRPHSEAQSPIRAILAPFRAGFSVAIIRYYSMSYFVDVNMKGRYIVCMRPKKVIRIKPLSRLKVKGGDLTDLRVQKKLAKNGNSACVVIPTMFLKNLGWKAGETEVYLTLNERREVVLTPTEQVKPVPKAS